MFFFVQGVIRFQDPDEAKNVWQKALEAGAGKVEVKGQEIEGRVLEGEQKKSSFLCTLNSVT